MSCFNNLFTKKKKELIETVDNLNANIKISGLNKSELLCLIMKLSSMRLPETYILNQKDLRCFNDYSKTKVIDLKKEILKYVPTMVFKGMKKPEILCFLFNLFNKKKLIPEKVYNIEPKKIKSGSKVLKTGEL